MAQQSKNLTSLSLFVQFPAVTICNKNLWRYSTLNHPDEEPGSNPMFEVLKDLYMMDRPKPPPPDKYRTFKSMGIVANRRVQCANAFKWLNIQLRRHH